MDTTPNPPNQTEAAGRAPRSSADSAAPASPPVQQIVVQTSSGTSLLRIFAWLGWAGFILCSLIVLGQWLALYDYFDTSEGVIEKYHSGNKLGTDKVAIIEISGIIMEGDGFAKRQIDAIRDDDRVKAVVVRVDSPGGTVSGSDYIYHHLKKLREEKQIPLVVSMGSVAASGGYYVSMSVGSQKKAIYAEPTTTTGSIGVIIPHYDLSGLLERFDVKDDSIASHPRKQMLSMTRPITDENREIIQGYVDESFDRFKSIVQEGRPVFRKDEDALKQLATGEIFSADKAKKFGLVDEIGFLEDAIDRALEMAKLSKDDARVIQFKRPVSLFGLSGFAEARSGRVDLSTLLELTTPRAFYLATSLPPLVSTPKQ
jgi:protease-4